MHGAYDVRVEDVPDARLVEPTDALVRVASAGICGSDLWPYRSMERDRPPDGARAISTFFDNITIAGGPAPARAYIPELVPDVLEGRIEPGRVFDRFGELDDVPDGYRAMNDRESIKVLIEP
jgi:threonine dehydrogenase-like Zn-dependent dehydrogenase